MPVDFMIHTAWEAIICSLRSQNGGASKSTVYESKDRCSITDSGRDILLPRPEWLWGRTSLFDVSPGVHQPEHDSTTHQHVVPIAWTEDLSPLSLCVCVVLARCVRRRASLRFAERSVSFILAEQLLLIVLEDNFVCTHPVTPVKVSYVGCVTDCNIEWFPLWQAVDFRKSWLMKITDMRGNCLWSHCCFGGRSRITLVFRFPSDEMSWSRKKKNYFNQN
jgi:hypothetical protein